MSTRDRLFRFTALVAAGSLMLAPVVPQPAFAQPAPPPGAATQQTGGDPPERVGRLARVTGTVSFHTSDDTQWNPATVNYPVTSGNAFWTEPNGEADIDVSASRVILAGASEFDVNALDNASLLATLAQGEIYVRVRALAPNEVYTVQTPRGQVTIAVPGRYGIVAGDTSNPTLVTVIEGAAQVSGPNLSLDVAANQTATVTGTDSFTGGIAPAQPDAFLTAMLARERPPPVQAVAPPPVVAQMTGTDDLGEYGSWSQTSDYGQVWYPQVAAGWVPYREGHWAYIAPWGWTWVDNAPWGFAPFHYGRWVDTGGRWGWTPGVDTGVYAPVYAPALVTFFGIAAGIGIGAALGAGSVGWAPLGWHEPYRPWYHTSDAYRRNVNRYSGNTTTNNRYVTINNYANRRGATVAPASALTGSQPIQRFGHPATVQQLAQARPVVAQEPVRPTAATAGVTPAVARQLHLAPAQAGTPAAARVIAPGPAITARPAPVVAGAKPVPPPLHNPAAAIPAVAPVHAPITAPAAQGVTAQPGGAQHLPPLATPGVRPAPTTPGGAPGPAFTPHTGAAVTGGPAAAPALVPHGTVTPTPGTGVPAAQAHPGLVPAPGAVAQPGPHVAAPATVSHTPPPVIPQTQHPVVAPVPQVHTAPPPAVHVAPPVATLHTAPPVVHAAPPPPVVHAAPPPPVMHAAPPPPVMHAAPPPPVMHAAPPPPVMHAAPPPPVMHAAPPPPVHAAPPPAPHPAPQTEKRPGQQ